MKACTAGITCWQNGSLEATGVPPSPPPQAAATEAIPSTKTFLM
jgi:hypothetical protein